ncbi:putative terminase small subunit [Pseudomonas phage SoKa]|uniref:Terminase small subunit n=1 Tax=Pseudomonas phage SoKa TaxID=2930393 RepID=A0AAE9GPZ0_9CAUD|nr:putative terminase small subunit [Pseudomonas phage SoKa]
MFTAYWEHRFAAAELTFEDEGYIPLTSNDLAVVRAFLKDNNITAEPGGDKDLARLGEQLARDLKGSVNQDELAGIMDEAKQWMGVPH